MAQRLQRAQAEPEAAAPPVRRRLTAEARKRSILQAARRAFSETGDVNGTTIRTIAEYGGISEGAIYRHFESKDQLFLEAVVEPLTEAVDALVAASEVVDREPLTRRRQVETMEPLYRQLVSTFEEVLPLLGLVLFGDPKVARRFYRESFAMAMDRLASAWEDVEDRQGIAVESTDLAVRAVMGIALMVAIESHHTAGFDRERAIELMAERTINGFFPRS